MIFPWQHSYWWELPGVIHKRWAHNGRSLCSRRDLTEINENYKRQLKLYDMTSHKLHQYVIKLVYVNEYVLCNLMPEGGKFWKVRRSVMAFFRVATHVEKGDCCICVCLIMPTQIVLYYHQSTRNFGLYETWRLMPYSACPGLFLPVSSFFYTCLINKNKQ